MRAERRIDARGITSAPLFHTACTIARRTGWRVGESGIRLGERPVDVDVLLVRPVPADCSVAVGLVASGSLSAALCTDALHELPRVLDAVAAGHQVLPDQLRRLAADVPPLSPRQLWLTQRACVGAAIADLSAQLGTSPATVKRELAGARRAFGAANRVAFGALATGLGFPTPLLELA